MKGITPKTPKVFALILMALTLVACKKEEAVKFDLSYESNFIIQDDAGISIPVVTLMSNMATDSKAEFEFYNTNKESIKKIELTSLEMEMVTPSGHEFDFMEDVEVFISANGVDENLLAYSYNMLNSVGTKISLTVALSDFQEYLKNDKYTLRVRTLHDEFLSNDVELKMKSTFKVDAVKAD